MEDLAGLALRVLRGIGRGVAALLEYINLRDGYRAFKRDVQHMKKGKRK
ncbi:hypothetical protein ACFSJS_27845 [Streptomyces desertarenae]|uniref:Uncharacterized protein n=1 Tax=Streptomyces desertarenae TaxID=2666184 RepID=A0ABW4PT34_9ACTN